MSKVANEYMRDIIVFIDRNGKVNSKFGTPVNCGLDMTYKTKTVRANFYVTSHCQGGGSSVLKVYYKNKKVYHAEGSFMGTPFGVTEKTYKPGKWEDVFGVKRSRSY